MGMFQTCLPTHDAPVQMCLSLLDVQKYLKKKQVDSFIKHLKEYLEDLEVEKRIQK